nr:hypothetical protein [Tanacetum cinerariifolium]
MIFGGNTRDLRSFREETNEITDLHQILEEVLLTECGDSVTSIKRRRRDPFINGVWNLETASGRGRLKEDLESSKPEKCQEKHYCYASTKAEYIAAVKASMEAVWIRKFIDRLGDVVPLNKRPMEMLYKMSRDVITVGSIMRIPLLYMGEYSQCRERFMNYFEEQTDDEAMINSIQNGDVNDALGYKKKVVVVTLDPLALVAEKMKVSKCKEKVEVQTESEESDEDISDLKKITALLAKTFNQKKYYAKPTNSNLRTSSASSSVNKKPEYVKSMEKKEDKKANEKKRDIRKVKCYNCKKEGHFAKDCKKAKVKYYNYYKTKMLLVKKDSDEQVLLAGDQAWMECGSDSDQEINANMVFMAQIEKDTLYNGKKGIGFENPSYFGKAKDLRPSLCDEKVIGLGYTPMFLIHSDEALEIKKFKRARENKIEFAYDYGNLNANLDTFSSVIRPNQSNVIWKKKGSSNTFNVDLSYVSHSKLNKDVKQYSHKDLLSCNNSHLGETSSAYVCNDAMNLSCNSRLGDSFDENNLFVFDDESVRISPRVQTDNGTEFKNKTLAKFFDEVGITQQFSATRTPQQNGVVERRNRTLVEAARIILTFTNLPSFLWAEAIAIACFTQNHSIIYKSFDKIPYELINKRKPNIKFFHVFRCRCYLLNDYEDDGKLKTKGDIGVLEPGLSNLNETGKSPNPSVSQVLETSKKDLEDLFQKFYDEYFDASKIMKSSTTNVETSNVEVPSNEEEVFHEKVEVPSSNTQSVLNNMVPNADEASTSHNVFNECLEDAYFDASTSFHDPSNVHTFYQPYPHEKKWIKDHPLHNIIGDLKSSVHTKGQLANLCLFSCLLSSIEPSNVAEALRVAYWVSTMQDERNHFARLKDVKTTFLNEILKEKVYVGQPTGFFNKQYPDHMYALDKALCGLKQAPRAWYGVLSQFLIESGF